MNRRAITHLLARTLPTRGKPRRCAVPHYEHQAAPSQDALSHCKLCAVEDFSRPELKNVLREIFAHEIARCGEDFPAGREYRKHWEVAMAVRALREHGALTRQAQVLGVAAGHEPTIFHLTRFVGRVFATDLYAAPGVWSEFANTTMLTEPARHWPGPWEPRRLVAQHMNALELQYEDASFDAIFSSSSIEHFGSVDNVRRAAGEMFRVLKPGGLLSISTEYRLAGPPGGVPGTLLFDADEIRDYIIGDRRWSLVEPLDVRLSAETLAGVRPIEDYLADWRRHFKSHKQAVWHQLDFRAYPQLLLRDGEHVFTSVHLALRKG